MKAYTDIEQSKKLAKILPFESADMCWFVPADDEDFATKIAFVAGSAVHYAYEKITDWNDTPYIPAWSLAALLGVLPDEVEDNRYFTLNKEGKEYCCFYEDYNGNSFRHTFADNPVDACYEIILKLNERKML